MTRCVINVFNALYSFFLVFAEIYTTIAYIYLLRARQGLRGKSLSRWVEFRRGGIRSVAQGVVIGNSIDIRTIWRTFVEGISAPRGTFSTFTEGKEANLESLTDV